MALATITTKGQVTIPKSVRDSLMLSTGDKIEFIVTNKREALIRPISKKVDEVCLVVSYLIAMRPSHFFSNIFHVAIHWQQKHYRRMDVLTFDLFAPKGGPILR